MLVFLQLGFAPASHSVARGSLEVASATTRGSIPSGALARVAELALTFGRAALPLFAFGAVGLWIVVHRWSSGLDRATVRFLHVPALVYLAAIFGLVTIGAYTGSHRYLYPALPSLALLAAAALDRYAPAVRLAAVAAAGLIAVAFLPVFASFAADNTGLIAAGGAAAGGSGVLITDSPVVAFYSGRTPSRIDGSQALPANRQDAIAWMPAHGVTNLVVEGISYYRATSLFPDLASGHATAPFGPLGEQARYRVAGGKPVYAYRLGTALMTQSIYPGVDAVISTHPVRARPRCWPRARGSEVAGKGAAGKGWDSASRSCTTPTDGSTRAQRRPSTSRKGPATVWKRTYQLDEIGGDAAHNYSFVPIASRGAIEVTYTVDATGVAIRRDATSTFERATRNRNPQRAVRCVQRLRRPLGAHLHRRRTWHLGAGDGTGRGCNRAASALVVGAPIAGAQLHAGASWSNPDFNWAGLDYLFPPQFGGADYHINVQEAR